MNFYKFSGDSKPFQQVHVADTQGNLLSILFWYELQEMALTDVVVVGQVLLVKNLQWRTFDKTATIQSGYNADYTHFVNRPKGPEVEQFMCSLDQKNKLAYVKECEAKIEVSLILIKLKWNLS